MYQTNDRETKIYVAGLPWVTNTIGLISYFQQFGEIVYANVVCDREGRSKGFGFVTFRDVESARSACENPNPIIDGRETSVKLAYQGPRIHNVVTAYQQQPQAICVEPYWNQFYQQYYYYYPWCSPYPQY